MPVANLILGPPLEGKRELTLALTKTSLAKNIPEIYILTDDSPETLMKKFIKSNIILKQDLIKFIDCYSHNLGIFSNDTPNIKRVSSPLAFNEISITITELQKEILRKWQEHQILFDSLSTILLYANSSTVARFLQILIGKIKKAGGDIFLFLEEGMHDEKTIITMEHIVDGVVRVFKEGEHIKITTKGTVDEKILESSAMLESQS